MEHKSEIFILFVNHENDGTIDVYDILYKWKIQQKKQINKFQLLNAWVYVCMCAKKSVDGKCVTE